MGALGTPEKAEGVEGRWPHLLVDHAQFPMCGRAKESAFEVSGYFAVEGG